MKKNTHPFVQLLMMVLLSVGLIILVSIPTAILVYKGVDVNSRNNLFWIQTLTQLLTFALPVFLMTLIYYHGRQREYYRFSVNGRQWINALTAVVILLLLLPAIDWLTIWNDSWKLGRMGELLRGIQEQTEGIMEQELNTDSIGGLFANLVMVALVPAVCEELFFRAGVQNLLQRWWSHEDGRSVGTHLAVWVTAIIFSLGHGEIFAFMPRFLMGLLLGYLYIYSGSLMVNMIAHFFNNAMVVLVYWLVNRGVLDIDPEAPLALGWPVVLCCSLAAVTLFAVSFVKRLKTND